MGSTPSKDQRHGQNGGSANNGAQGSERRSRRADSSVTTTVYAARTARSSRPDLSFLGIGSSSRDAEVEVTRKETKQEREARKLEKERKERLKERERSMKEEHVDGGYLVTQGVYTGTEDFNKAVVRQLMIERRIAPFWRGLDDHNENWVEHQLVAAARGLPIPAADEMPAEDSSRKSNEPAGSSSNIQNLTVPITSRTQSTASEANLSPAHPAFQSSPNSPDTISPPHSASILKPKSRTLASLTTSSKTISQSDISPREIQLPKDPNVNGLALEAYLYRDASECPICFLYYPPYLNSTRCCDQAICSECFVQIKRPDPHPPEHEHADPANPTPPPPAEQADPDTLVSEPACCPYCQQAEFGVTYEPPPFRRGLAYENGVGSFTSAMSSNTSINSGASPGLAPNANRRRTTSVSADDATVITTDRVRPDWATKLANARNTAARRAAAATALHTAAYLMGNGAGPENRTFGFGSRSRFNRNRADSNEDSGNATPSGSGNDANNRVSTFGPFSAPAERMAVVNHEGHGMAGQVSTASRRRARAEDIEDMMMMEAIRLSLAAEDERKKKEEKQAAKDAKKKEKEEKKEEKKKEKAGRKSMYGNSSASGSALSLSLPFGRKRGNSESSTLRRETTNQSEKGKSVDRGDELSASRRIPGSSHGEGSSAATSGSNLSTSVIPEGEALPTSSPTATAPEKPSHLRQMSNVSSPASSFIESAGDSATHTPSGKEVDRNSETETPPTEPMFNFNSLKVTLESDEDKASSGHVEHAEGEASQSAEPMEESIATLRDPKSALAPTPEVMVTPETPLAGPGEDSKQLGESMFGSRNAMGITQ